jgi:Rrf2 family iron-sulfur cluster assembly transcriptional regulator
MKLTTRTRYALRALIQLAQPGGNGMNLKMIAEHQKIQPKYLEQILLQLRRAGMVGTKKGPGGGYYLMREPGSIALADIMVAVGESTAPVRCVSGRADKYCSGIQTCTMKPVWMQLKEIIDGFLENHTLEDLIQDENKRCVS